MPLGIGTERVEEEIKQKMPEVKIFRLDKTSATTVLHAKKIVAQWMDNPGSVLVGTEFALTYIHTSIDTTAVASLDSLFALPDFRINERVFSLILKLRTLAEKNLLIQSRFPEQKAIQYGIKGNIGDFLRDELELRNQLSFPPFSTFIKVSFEGNRLDAEKAIEHIRSIAGTRRVEIFPAFISTIKKKFMLHALIILPRGTWIDKELLDILRTLPLNYSVNVDPESIL